MAPLIVPVLYHNRFHKEKNTGSQSSTSNIPMSEESTARITAMGDGPVVTGDTAVASSRD